MTEATTLPSNSVEDLKRRVDRRRDILDQIAELQEEIKAFKAEDKAEGYTERVIGQAIKELRKGAEYQADQLSLELELHTYRTALGLPVTLEDAQARAAEEAATLPDHDDDSGDSLKH